MLYRLLLLCAVTAVPSFSACIFTLTPASASFPNTSGDATVSVSSTGGTSCPWTASSNTAWITISFGTSGTNSGTVGYTVTQNNTTSQRSGSLTVAGINFPVTQAAAPCTYSLSPGSATVGPTAGSGTFSVTSACAWSASSNATWLTVQGSGTGNGTVHYLFDDNPAASSRTGTITAGTQTFTITQTAACIFTLNPLNAQFEASGGNASVQVQATANSCAWTAVNNNPDFITISSALSGTGNGTIGYSVAANTTASARSGSIQVGNSFLNLYQAAGQGCTFALSPSSTSVPSSGGSGGFTVKSNCAWTPTTIADWITVLGPATSTGNGTVLYTVAGNTTPQTRTASIFVGAAAFSIQQAGITCSVTVAPASFSVNASGGSGSISVIAPDGCNWSAASNASWTTLNTAGGTGEGTVAFTAAANTTPQARSATVTIANQTVRISEDAADCSGVTLAPDHANVAAPGGRFVVNVTSLCGYSASSNNGWITIVDGASAPGGGTVAYQVGANTSANARSGSLTIGGIRFAVVQAGADSTISLNPASAQVTALGASGSIAVSCAATCDWIPVTDQGWIKFTYAAANGTGKIDYTVDATNRSDTRTGNIFVGGQAFVITQAGRPALQFSSNSILNAGSFTGGAVAPGEVITVFGAGIGPAIAAGVQLTSNGQAITSVLSDTRVFFDDTPAPLIYVSSTQVSAIVPYAVAGKASTQMRIEFQGFRSDTVTLDIVPTAPAIFTADASGSGQGAILNEDGTINGAAQPAGRGSTVAIYGTGEGQTIPAGVDGRLADARTLARPAAPVTVQIGGIDARVTYAGGAPGLPAGVLQVNAVVPANAAPGAQPVVLKIGTASSRPDVTVSLK